MVGGIAQEINARSDVLKIERQLEEARSKLAAIRRAKYQEKTGGTGGYTDDSDFDFDAPETSRSVLKFGSIYNQPALPYKVNFTIILFL